MSANTLHSAHSSEHEHHGSNSVFGFWIYLMSDCILFASIFAAFAVLSQGFAGGPTGKDIFELDYVLIETFLLLFSSVTYGFAMLAMNKGNQAAVMKWLAVTFVFGAGFIAMEINEFAHLIHIGAGPDRSAFLSGFFTLVGTHGLHVFSGLIWMIVMMIQVAQNGLSSRNQTRLMCLSLFWHFLDVVWICVFTVVYLMGVL